MDEYAAESSKRQRKMYEDRHNRGVYGVEWTCGNCSYKNGTEVPFGHKIGSRACAHCHVEGIVAAVGILHRPLTTEPAWTTLDT